LARKLSLAVVASELTIPIHYLEALEEGDLTIFPAEVYARGAYMKYAHYLGVETKQMDQAFLRALCNARELVPLKLHTPRSWLARVMTGRWLLMVTLSFLAMVVGGYLLWQVQSFLRLPGLRVITPAQGIITDETLTVEGWVEDQAVVNVNGEAVFVADDGSFSAPLRLHRGINVLRVEATNAAGRSRIVERDLLVPRF
jgi:hypothetical protein